MSDTDSDVSSDVSSRYSRENPKYSPQELGAILLDFYQFLTTLHYESQYLKIPPSQGWPNMTQEWCGNRKSELTLETLRHLPYFDYHGDGTIHYKARTIDFTAYDAERWESAQCRYDDWEDGDEDFVNSEGDVVDLADVVCIVGGHESYGREFFLDVINGEITENMIRAQGLGPVDIQEFFSKLRAQYRNLQLIPCPGRITMETDDVEEREEHITLEEVCAQEANWKTNLDCQYVRQVYRSHGWPEAFRRDEATMEIGSLMDVIRERRGDWQEFPEDWHNTIWV